jgi:hypothetical protein
MTTSRAIETAKAALRPLGLFSGALAADAITALEADGSTVLNTDDGRRIQIRNGEIEIVPADPKRF